MIFARPVLIFLGFTSLLLGLIGVWLPVLPTTPFVLLASYFFARSSPTLHHWLLTHPRLGPPLALWEEHGVIGIRAKICAVLMIGASVTFLHIADPIDPRSKYFVTAVCVGVVLFLLTRPSAPRTRHRGPS